MASKKTPSRSRSDIRHRQKRRRIFSIALLILVVGTIPWWSHELSQQLASKMTTGSSHFRVEHVVVTGTKILPPETVLALANIPMGQLLFELPFHAIEQRVGKNPWIKAVQIRRRLPDTVELSVTERIPVAAVRGEQLMVLTADSLAIAPPSENWVWDLPILSPPRPARLENGARVKDQAVLALLQQTAMARAVTPEIWKSLSELYFSRNQIRAVLNSPRAELIAENDANELAWIGLHHFLLQSELDDAETQTVVDMRIPGKLIVSQEGKETAEQRAG